MKAVISILIIIGFFFGVFKIWEYYDTVNQQKEAKRAAAEPMSPSSLSGLPRGMERDLERAQAQGAKTFKAWVDQNRYGIQDPRLAWIELDLVLLLSKIDPAEAKKLFNVVKARAERDMESTSPVRRRVRDLEKTYE